jgi:glutamate-1-semialdehyde 2,1-aminomutase
LVGWIMASETQAVETQRVTEKSESVLKAAKAVIPEVGLAGVEAAPKTKRKKPEPLTPTPVIAKGKGAVVHDVDGGVYLDYDLAGGAIVLGHADERVVAAVTKAAAKGFAFSGTTESQVRLAEMLAGRFDSIEMVRFTHSRARALAGAIRLVRHVTGRDAVVVCAGTLGERIARAGEAALSFGERVEGDGRTACDADGVLVVPHGDRSALERVFQEHGSRIGAVVVEPLAYSLGLVTPDGAWFSCTRGLCDQHSALLIYDDAIGALRSGPGGSEKLLGVKADLMCIGAELGAALPMAVYGGRRDIMKHAAEVRELSTFGDAPTDDLAVAAAAVMLQAVAEEGFFEELDARAARWEQGLRSIASASNGELSITRVTSLIGVRFGRGGRRDQSGGRNELVRRYDGVYRAALERGIMLPASPLTPWSVSAAHTNDDIDRTIEACETALRG